VKSVSTLWAVADAHTAAQVERAHQAAVSEMLGIPIHTLYRWRHKGDGPVGYRVGRQVRYRREAVEAWLEQQADKR
jgi:excisionase family DNA binding protein